jgi:hypothetical protein
MAKDRAALQVAAGVGAVLGGVTGYLLSYQVENGGWFKILIWALIGAVVVRWRGFLSSGFSFLVSGLSKPSPTSAQSRRSGPRHPSPAAAGSNI